VGGLSANRKLVVRPDITKGAYVGVVQGRDRMGFALKALGELFVGNLDCDNAIQSRVAGLIDLTHVISYGPRRVPGVNGMSVERLYRWECNRGTHNGQAGGNPKVRFADHTGVGLFAQ
jgi:hypothetical protein